MSGDKHYFYLLLKKILMGTFGCSLVTSGCHKWLPQLVPTGLGMLFGVSLVGIEPVTFHLASECKV